MRKENGQAKDRILIIDDNPSVHESFRRIFGRSTLDGNQLQEMHTLLFDERATIDPRRQFELDSAFSGEEGLELVCRSFAEQRPYTLVFIDICMPVGWDGLETINRIREKFPELNIVICTGYSKHSWEAVAECLGDLENLAILRKPFEREEALQLAYMFSCKCHRLAAQKRTETTPQNDEFRILVLEDEPLTSMFLQKKLTENLPEAVILTAKTVAEARALTAPNPRGGIDFFLIDIFLPDGTGIDFLLEVMSKQAEVRAVVMTSRPLGEFRAIVNQLGALQFLEKPVNVSQIVGLIKPLIQAKKLAQEADTSSFVAALKRLTTLDVIQLKCLGRATTLLVFTRTDGAQGWVWFQQGEVVHAEAPGKSGEAAFIEIAGWREGRVEEVSGGQRFRQTITVPSQVLLLNTVRELDEAPKSSKGS